MHVSKSDHATQHLPSVLQVMLRGLGAHRSEVVLHACIRCSNLATVLEKVAGWLQMECCDRGSSLIVFCDGDYQAS